MTTRSDISGLADIRIFVDDFYMRVKEDELLSPIFNYRLSTHWGPHLEKMYAFWNAALFGEKGYNGNPFMKHATMELDPVHFERWLSMFNDSIDKHFEGPVADDAKKRAEIMAAMFSHKLDLIKKNNTKPIF